MDANPFARTVNTVIALDHDRDLVAKTVDAGIGHNEPGGPRQPQAEMLVFRVAVPLASGRFKDMGCWCTTGRNAPPAVLKQKSRLWLGSRKAELARICRGAPCGVIGSQYTEAFGNFILRKPSYFSGSGFRAEFF